MKRGHKIYPFSWFFVLSLSLLLGQQTSSYLTQKLMVESDLRSRIASALSKIIDDQKYVIDVDVDIEVTGEKEEQITNFKKIDLEYLDKNNNKNDILIVQNKKNRNGETHLHEYR